MAQLKQSTAYTRAFLMVDSSDHVTGKTGLTVAVTLSKAGGSFASAGGTVTEISSGWYNIALTTTDTNTLGELAYHCTSTGADPTDFVDQVSARINDDFAYPATSGRSMVVDAAGLVDSNVVKIGPSGSGTAQTARDVGASVLLSAGTGTGQLDFTSGVVKSNLAQILGTALTETAGQIAAAFKKFFNIATPASTMDALTLVATATNLTNAPTAGDFTSTMKTSIGTAVAASAVASVTGNVGGNVVGSVGSVTARVTANTDQLAGQTVTAGAGVTFPASVASPTNITAASGVALTAAYDPAKTAAQAGDAMTLTGAYDAAKTAAQAGTAMTLTSAYDFAKGTVAMTESYAALGAAMTPAQALHEIRALLAERSISSVTLTAKKIDGTTTAATYTLDDATNPSAQTRAS